MPLTLACLALSLIVAESEPYVVQAWRGTGEPKGYPTRTVDRLTGFTPSAVQLSPYGGWLGERHEATGFFRAEKLGDRWWLIDPEGYRYLHMAVNGVSVGSTPTNLRVFPDKFGTKEAWRDATLDLLLGAGFNGSGNWSDPATVNSGERKLAYCTSNSFIATYGRQRGKARMGSGHNDFDRNVLPVFDPEFDVFCAEFAQRLAATKDDPWLLGHFTDNELPFNRTDLATFLKLEHDDPGYQAAVAWLQAQGRDPVNPFPDAVKYAFKGYVYETYLQKVCGAIRQVDPNHMILGSRLYGGDVQARSLLSVAGQYLEVVAVNVYGTWTPNETIDRMAGWADKPIIPTEWYAKGQDSGLENITGAGWTVATQAERGAFYQNFCLGLLECRNAVGWHWFKYMDNDPLDTKADPSNRNSNKGIVTCSYEPYTPLIDAMRELNAQAYPLTAWFDDQR